MSAAERLDRIEERLATVRSMEELDGFASGLRWLSLTHPEDWAAVARRRVALMREGRQ